MQDRLCFVQFIHPGGEHWPDGDFGKDWNRDHHRRKFLRSPGRFLDADVERTGELVFWGEWEAESAIAGRFDDPIPDGPHHIFDPYFVPRSSYAGLQNTDPFVFGERFLYTGCLQHANGRPTQLRNLLSGSVILFGSCLHRERFVLDTVFVVHSFIDHSHDDYRDLLDGAISETYKAVTIAPWYDNAASSRQSYRLYLGATFDQPVNGMFSFFPCLPFERSTKGFARPTIRIPTAVTDTLNQGKRLNPQASPGDTKSLWDEVVAQVRRQDLLLGVTAALPPALEDSNTSSMDSPNDPRGCGDERRGEPQVSVLSRCS